MRLAVPSLVAAASLLLAGPVLAQSAGKGSVLEELHFDFGRDTLGPGAARMLDDVVRKMQGDAGLKLEIEGHTCDIGTPEHNLALGERRASAVKDYLVSRGIDAGRLRTASYGEERPKYDNLREETRRLNRRVMLVRLEP